jgi:transcriptional regulator with XRE-family HTH domain
MNCLIAATIKTIRKIFRVTQEEFAEIIGMSSGYVGMLEQGRAKPSYDTLSKLKTNFGLDINMFFEPSQIMREINAEEIRNILGTLSDKQVNELIQLLQICVQIVKTGERGENRNSRA